MTTAEQLLEEVQRFVHDESRALRLHFQKMWEPPVATRVQEGRCIHQLQFAGVEPDKGLRFNIPSPNVSELRQGDLVRLCRSEPVLSLFEADLLRLEDDAL